MIGKSIEDLSLKSMKSNKKRLCLVSMGLLGLSSSCAPLRTSPHDEKHHWELKLHEVQTHLDELKHDLNCFQTELQIMDGKIRYYENALSHFREQDLEKQKEAIDQMGKELRSLSQKWNQWEKAKEAEKGELLQLSSYANETQMILSQFKTRLVELEQMILTQNRRFEEISKIKSSLESVAKSLKPSSSSSTHRVKPGETLEKIALLHQTKVDRIKKLNELSSDLIVIGQELKIPQE